MVPNLQPTVMNCTSSTTLRLIADEENWIEKTWITIKAEQNYSCKSNCSIGKLRLYMSSCEGPDTSSKIKEWTVQTKSVQNEVCFESLKTQHILGSF